MSGSRPDATGRRVLSDWKGSFVSSPSSASAAAPDHKEQEKALDNLFGAPLAPAGVAPILPTEPVRAPEPEPVPEPRESVPEPRLEAPESEAIEEPLELEAAEPEPVYAPIPELVREPAPPLPADEPMMPLGLAAEASLASSKPLPLVAPKRPKKAEPVAPPMVAARRPKASSPVDGIFMHDAPAAPIVTLRSGPPHLRLPRREVAPDPHVIQEQVEGREMRMFAVELAKILLVSHDRSQPMHERNPRAMRVMAVSLAGVFAVAFLGSAMVVTAALVPPVSDFVPDLAKGSQSLGFNVPSGPDTIIECHKPGTPAEQIKVLPAAAGPGHEGHGDDAGACEGEGGGGGQEDKSEVCHAVPGGNHTLLLPLSAIDAHLAHGDTQGACDDLGGGGGGGGDKVDVCHIAGSGNHTLSLPLSAVAAHLSHGDSMGACPDDGGGGGGPEDVTFCHFASQNTMTLPAPAADAHLRNHDGDHIGACDDGGGGGGDVTFCHFASQNTMTLPAPAADAHLRNHDGDHLGACDGGGGGNNSSPIAAFSHSCVRLACSYDGSASSDPDGSIVNWTWAINPAFYGPTANFTYPAPGTYTATLTVTDDGGATASVSHQIHVSNGGGGGGGSGGSGPSDGDAGPSGSGGSGSGSGSGADADGDGPEFNPEAPRKGLTGSFSFGLDVALEAISGGRSRRRHSPAGPQSDPTGEDAPEE